MADELLLGGDGAEGAEDSREEDLTAGATLDMETTEKATTEDATASEEGDATNSVIIPGEDASPEEMKEFYKKLGAPDDVSGYDEVFDREGVEWGEIDPIKQAALEAGLTPAQLAKVTDAYVGVVSKQQTAAKEDTSQSVVEGLRKEWGREYDANLGLAIQTAKTFGGKALMTSLESSGLGNNKELIQTFSSIGKALASEGIIDGAPVGRVSKKDAEAKAQSIMSSPAYLNAKDPQHGRAVAEATKLMELAYPESATNPYV